MMSLKNLALLACAVAIAIALPFGLQSTIETADKGPVEVRSASLTSAETERPTASATRNPVSAPSGVASANPVELEKNGFDRLGMLAEALREDMEMVDSPIELRFVQPRGVGQDQLEPRRVRTKKPVESIRFDPSYLTEELVVKFRDEVRARVTPEARGQVRSDAGRNLNTFADIVEEFGLEVRSAFHMSEERLRGLEERAEQNSGRAQPDLAGMMIVTGPTDVIERAAREIHQLETVEYVTFHPIMKTHRMPRGGGPTAACCLPSQACIEGQTVEECNDLGGDWLVGVTTCQPGACISGACCVGGNCLPDVLQVVCDQNLGVFGAFQECEADSCETGACCVGTDCFANVVKLDCEVVGVFVGVGTICDPDDDPCEELDCGEPSAGDCFSTNANPYCDVEDCCNIVCDIYPFCCNEDFGQWDEVCVGLADCFCSPITTDADRCNCPFAGECFEVGGQGCRVPDCCNAVCDILPFCCIGFWSQECVDLANELEDCILPDFPDGVTPDFSSTQGYRTPGGYTGTEFFPPAFPAPLFPGHNGEGFFLEDLTDPNDPFSVGNPYAGLYGLGRFLIDEFGIGADVEDFDPVYGGVRGASINVAVVEWAYYPDHEDLDVIAEPGQTMIFIPETEPDHGTASLGVIGARLTDPPSGLIGIAPDSQLYFFPITSVEQGPRPFTAIANAFETLQAGDVISHSWGPGPPIGNLNNSEPYWDLFRLGSDIGITTFVSAGNDCFDLSAANDEGDSGAIVVGAVTPGRNPDGSGGYRRIPFSNFTSNQADVFNLNQSSNVVHISGWGTNVASTGYGALFAPEGDPNRAYTDNYGGTSAAGPMVAGLAACLQGLAKQFYGIPLAPETIRALLQTRFGQSQGAFEVTDNFARDENGQCGPDLNPDNPLNRIIGFTNARAAGAAILTQNTAGFDTPSGSLNIQNVYTIRGRHLFGNVFSVSAPDNLFYFAESRFTKPNQSPNFIPSHLSGPVGQIKYRNTGQIADVLAEAKFANPSSITDFQVQVFALAPPTVPGIVFLEAYDWVAGRWQFLGVTLFEPGGEIGFASDPILTFQPARFVNQQTGQALVRVGAHGFTQIQPGVPNALPDTFVFRVDAILLNQTLISVPTPLN